MGKGQVELYNAQGETKCLLFDPETLTIIDDPSHALYDRRVLLPLDEDMVVNIMTHGVKKPIVVSRCADGSKYDGLVIVDDGRMRVRHLVEANRRIVAAGGQPMRIKAMVERGTTAELATMAAYLNAFVIADDDPINIAERAQKMLDLGKTKAEVARSFKRSVQTIDNWLTLLETHPDVQAAVTAGTITAGQARSLAAMPPAAQPAAMAALQATRTPAPGAVTNGPAAANRGAATATPARPRGRTRGQIESLLVRVDGMTSDGGTLTMADMANVLRWCLGTSDVLPDAVAEPEHATDF